MQIEVPGLLTSKKFGAAVLASLLAFGGKLKGFDDSTILFVIGPLIAYIGAQGLADIGKARADAGAAGTTRITNVQTTTTPKDPS